MRHCPNVLAGVAKTALVIVLMASIGLHWALLQSVAWAGMVVDYSRNTSLAEALSRTFDGQHPCRMCCLIREAQKQEKKQDIQVTTVKLEAPAPVPSADFGFAARPILPLPGFVTPASAALDAPPLPPPRTA